MKKYFEKFKEGLTLGISISLGILIVFGILVGVYAFVEPSSTPSIDSVMTSFTSSQGSLTANNGMYDNRISEGSFPNAYTEICYKNGNRLNDQHSGGETTAGGNCLPGDVGYVIEQNERSSNYWEQAKSDCLEDGMRLPEPFEYKVACVDAATLGLSSMTGNWEWSSNSALAMYDPNRGLAATILGHSGCAYAAWDWIGYGTGAQGTTPYRCVK